DWSSVCVSSTGGLSASLSGVGRVGIRRNARGCCPFRYDAIANGQQRGTDEHANETEGRRSTQNSKEDQYERHVTSLADEPGFDEVIYGAYGNAPDNHKYSPTVRALMEKPKRRREHDERRPHGNDREEKNQHGKQCSSWDPGDDESKSSHQSLHQS